MPLLLDVVRNNSIREICREQWDMLTKNNVFMCYALLKAYEESLPSNITPVYFRIFDKGSLVGASLCFFQDQCHHGYDVDSILLGRLKKYMARLGISFLPSFSCGARRGYGAHVLIDKSIDQAMNEKITDRLIDEAELIAKSHDCPVFFNNVMYHEKVLIEKLRERGYCRTLGLPVNYLDIEWDTFEEYKKYVYKKKPSMKRSLNRQINKNRKAGVDVHPCSHVDMHHKKIFDLLRMNYDKYNSDELQLPEDYIVTLKENLGDDLIIYVAEKNGEIIAASVMMKHDDILFTPYVGVDHKRSKGDLSYFNVAYYTPIKDAISQKIKRIYYGNALYDLKARRGCKAEDVYIFYKTFTGPIQFLVGIWFKIHMLWMKCKFIKIERQQFTF